MAGVERAKVALVQRSGRYENVVAALERIAGRADVDPDPQRGVGTTSAASGALAGVRSVLVKPNFVSVDHQLAATHVDAVRAVLDFVRARYQGPVVVAEGAALAPTQEGFHNYGYEPLAREYGVELVDLNTDETVPVQVYDRRLRPLTVRLARTVVEADYRISVGPPKTHDVVLVTLSIKNMVMGSLVNPQSVNRGNGTPGLVRRIAGLVPKRLWWSRLAEWGKGAFVGRVAGSSKMAMHQGFPVINLNLALVAPYVWPHLAVIDGWEGMEGEGPGAGEPVAWRVALAAADPLALDTLVTHLMGFDPGNVGYLCYCGSLGLGVGNLEHIETVGNVAPGALRAFRPHPMYRRQLTWHLDGAEGYLRAGIEGAPDAADIADAGSASVRASGPTCA